MRRLKISDRFIAVSYTHLNDHNLDPSDFWLFQSSTLLVQGMRQDSEECDKAANTEDCVDCFKKWKRGWDKCLKFQEKYFKDNKGHIVLHKLLFLLLVQNRLLLLDRPHTVRSILRLSLIHI